MSAIGKLFNTVLNNRLDKFLMDNNIISNCQIGFSKNARTADHMFILKTLIDKYCSKTGWGDYMLVLWTFVKHLTL